MKKIFIITLISIFIGATSFCIIGCEKSKTNKEETTIPITTMKESEVQTTIDEDFGGFTYPLVPSDDDMNGETWMEKIVTEIDDVFIAVTKEDEEQMFENHWNHSVYFNGNLVASYGSENIEPNIELFYNENDLKSYKIGTIFYYKMDSELEFLRLGLFDYSDNLRPLLYSLIESCYLNSVNGLYENKDPYAIKLIKEYANGDFSKSKNVNMNEDEVKTKQEVAKMIVEEYGF